MREQNIEVKMKMSIPIDKPDLNGIMYSKEAIENAIKNSHDKCPLVYRDNEDTNPVPIGFTSVSNYEFDDDTQTFKVEFDGMVFFGGADISVNKATRKNGHICIEDFTFNSIGMSL